MKGQDWFSARIRLVILIESQGAVDYMGSVFAFLARDFEAAFQRAIAIGRANESEYLNGDNERVRCRLKEVISLDIVGAKILDGAEVYSERVPIEAGIQLAFDTSLDPESSHPTQTI